MEYSQLKNTEQELVMTQAQEWFNTHKETIQALAENYPIEIDPVDEELYNPQTWTKSNWKWFIQQKQRENSFSIKQILKYLKLN